MSPIKREYILYLEDMLQSMKRINEYLENIDFPEFKKTYMIVDATIRNFEVIGEASKNCYLTTIIYYPKSNLWKTHTYSTYALPNW